MTDQFEASRRRFVVAGVGGVGAVLLGCGDDAGAEPGGDGGSGAATSNAGSSGSANGEAGAAGSANGTGGAGGSGNSCTVYPAQTEGPFYVPDELVRSDIREGKAGAELSLEIVVQRASDCAPLSGVAVDIWHCDADGVYSGYPNQLGGLDTTGQVFLRGTQLTDADGRVRFVTIYPGWYPGRTTHIHFKVHPSATSEATSQLYFVEAVNTEVYAVAPYAAHGQKDTSNPADAIAGAAPLVTAERDGAGYSASLTVTVA